MPGRLTTLVKGSFCRSVETELKKWVDANDKKKLLEWLADFENLAMPLEAVATKWNVLPPGGSAHYQEFFGNGAGCFFPELEESIKLGVVRGAFIQGLRASVYQTYDPIKGHTERQNAKPIVVYWIAGGPAFEAYVADSQAEIHVVLMTPDPTPNLKVPQQGADEPIWIVASPGRAAAIRDRAPYAYKNPEPMPAGIGIECQLTKSY